MGTKQRVHSGPPPEDRGARQRKLEDAGDSLLSDEDAPDLRLAIVATFAIALAGALLVLALL